MKLKIDKIISKGEFRVGVKILEFSADEQEKIEKFGSPEVSIEPKEIWDGINFKSAVPIHTLNYTFEFETEQEAANFADALRGRVQEVMTNLRNMRDDFSGSIEYEL